MEVLCDAIDLIIAGRTTGTTAAPNSVVNAPCDNSPTPPASPEEVFPIAKDSSSYTQISVASSEPSDDDETTTAASVPPASVVRRSHGDSRLNWRLHPRESYSDCTIEIVLKSVNDPMTHIFTRPTSIAPPTSQKVYTYHVHRSVLAYGGKRSMYFVKLFQRNYEQCNDAEEENLYKKCHLYLTKDVAKTFPTLLDYMYATEDTQAQLITRHNVISLHFLSKILQITCLRSQTEKFYEDDMSILNCYTYYQHAHATNGQKIMKAATKIVIENLSKIKLQSDLLTDFNAITLWKHVVQARHRKNTDNESIQISTLITCFCKLHRKVITKEDFMKLTDVRFLPVVHYQVALPLLELSKELRTIETTGNLSKLQMRCLDSFVNSWKVWMANPSFQQTLSKLDVYELYYLLNKALENSGEAAPVIKAIRYHQAQRNDPRPSMNHQKASSASVVTCNVGVKRAPPASTPTKVALPVPPPPIKTPPLSPQAETVQSPPQVKKSPPPHIALPPPPQINIPHPPSQVNIVHPPSQMNATAHPPPQMNTARLPPQMYTLHPQPPQMNTLHPQPHQMNTAYPPPHMVYPPIQMNTFHPPPQHYPYHQMSAYQQIMQQREICWNNFRSMKRKQGGSFDDGAEQTHQHQHKKFYPNPTPPWNPSPWIQK
jgi:hypothetical protein